MRLSFESSSFLFCCKSNYDRNSLFCLSFFLIQNLSIFETETKLDKHSPFAASRNYTGRIRGWVRYAAKIVSKCFFYIGENVFDWSGHCEHLLLKSGIEGGWDNSGSDETILQKADPKAWNIKTDKKFRINPIQYSLSRLIQPHLFRLTTVKKGFRINTSTLYK